MEYRGIGEMDLENIGTIGTSLVSGTLVGILIGYAIKKIAKIGLIIVGSFFGGVAYLQLQGLLNINWERIEVVSNQVPLVLQEETQMKLIMFLKTIKLVEVMLSLFR